MAEQSMWTRLGGRLKEIAGGKPSETGAPEGARIYAIGDIHGRDDLLADLLVQIEADAATAPVQSNILVYLGDYIDRGLQSKQVLDRLTGERLPDFRHIFLKGNHEQALLQFLADPAFGKTWKYYGGLETLHSYGVKELTRTDDPEAFVRAREHLIDVMPEAHRHFLETLEISVEIGGYFFAHAGVRPGIALHRQIEEDLLWIRDAFVESRASFGKIVVHGHTPNESVVIRPNRIGIDTGAYMTGVLTALVLEGTGYRFIQTGEVPLQQAASG